MEQTVETEHGIKLQTECLGSPADPTVLLISGHSATKTLWKGFDDVLVANGCRVIKFDNRDAGCSQRFDLQLPDPAKQLQKQKSGEQFETAYSLPELVRDAVAVLDYYGATTAHVVGESMGGLIAQLLATTHPERVTSLTLMMTAAPFWSALARGASKDGGALLTELDKLYQTLPAPDRNMSEAEFLRCSLPFWHLLADLSDGDSSQEKIETILQEDFRRGAVDWGRLGGYRQSLAVAKWEASEVDHHLEALGTKLSRIPTLVCHGVHDPLIPVECGRELAERIPGSTLLEYSGGHNHGSLAVEKKLATQVAEHIHSNAKDHASQTKG